MKKLLSLLIFAYSSFASASTHFEAYKVGIDRVDGFEILFTDGSEATYAGESPLDAYYLDEVVIYRDGSDWYFCHDGQKRPIPYIKSPADEDQRVYLDIDYNELELLPACY